MTVVESSLNSNKKLYKKPKGRFLKGGYWYLKIPYYFSAEKSGLVREHIFFYQEFHKCCMLPWGEIHHIDGKPMEENANRLYNLQGMMDDDHTRLHTVKDMSKRFCEICNSKTTNISRKGYHHWYKYENGFICHKCKCDIINNKIKLQKLNVLH